MKRGINEMTKFKLISDPCRWEILKSWDVQIFPALKN